jgi:uncharacterized protein (TIGR00266 family)
MKFDIAGDNLQMVTLDLEHGERIFAEPGAMVNMSGTMQMDTYLVGGILKGIKRVAGGESFFLTEFTPVGHKGFVSFAGRIPGKIFVIRLQGNAFIAQKEAFLCSEEGVALDIMIQKKIAAGILGGEGFILQRFDGTGQVFLHCCGDIIERYLEPEESVKVATGLVVGFDDTVTYDITITGGVSTILFGNEGLFLTTLTGPGKVVLQSMNLGRLAASLIPYLPKPKPESSS